MPFVIVHGMPDCIKEELAELRQLLQEAIAKVKVLRIRSSVVNVVFPSDQLSDGLGKVVIAEVRGLFKDPDRTPGVRFLIATAVMEVLATFSRVYLPGCRLVEVYVHTFDQEAGGFVHINPQSLEETETCSDE